MLPFITLYSNLWVIIFNFVSTIRENKFSFKTNNKMNTSNYSQKISKGDVILIDNNLEFIADKDCELTIKGDAIDSYGNEKISVKDYHISCQAINIDAIKNEGHEALLETINGEKPFIVHTSTDIGGFCIFVNSEKIAFCHNGFGDGNYRLKFTEGNLYR